MREEVNLKWFTCKADSVPPPSNKRPIVSPGNKTLNRNQKPSTSCLSVRSKEILTIPR